MQNLSNFDLESIYSDDPTDAIKKILDSYSQFEIFFLNKIYLFKFYRSVEHDGERSTVRSCVLQTL